MTSSISSAPSVIRGTVLTCCVLVLSACSIQFDVGSGPTVSDSRQIEAFTRLEVEGAWDVTLEQGIAPSLDIEIGQDLLDDVVVDQVGDRLSISLDRSGILNSGPMKVRITTPQLESIKIEGAVEADFRGFEKVDDLELEVTGAADLDITGLAADSVAVTAEGAASVTIEGSAQALVVTADGAADLDFQDLAVARASLEANGATSVDLTRAEAISGTIDGGASLQVDSDAEIDVVSSGAASVDRD